MTELELPATPNEPNEAEIADMPAMLECWQQTLHWQPNATQQQQFQQFYRQVVQGNRQLNLTRITDPSEFWEKHLWDSLRALAPWLSTPPLESLPESPLEALPESPLESLPETSLEDSLAAVVSSIPTIPAISASPTIPSRIIDIGTGAGFPGVPVAIALPTATVTLLDSTQKKIAFLNAALPASGITNAKPMVGRAETLGRGLHHREIYDLALIRAVAAVSVCAEYALPLLAVGGQAVLYRGQWSDEEHESLQAAVQKLGGAIAGVDAFSTPLSRGARHCIYLHKVKPTPPQFPRSIGTPSQHPL
ncbi:MAG TPA: 16S rRNA (guanine(527)-N(7))-methyltransferase RsmG [Chroococcidiopsis sp.]